MSDDKAKFKWNPEQEKAVYYNGGDLLVSASAGSGKTTVMLGRVLRLIDNGCSIDRMLISTFTVSAADDMRVKLARKLREKYAETRDAKYLSELDKLPSANICTMDKWCQRIARKYFYVCGDDSAFDIADGSESALWINESVADAFDEEEARLDDEYIELCACFVRNRRNDDLRKTVAEMLNFASVRAAFVAFKGRFHCTELLRAGLTDWFCGDCVCTRKTGVFMPGGFYFQNDAAVERQRKSKCRQTVGLRVMLICGGVSRVFG